MKNQIHSAFDEIKAEQQLKTDTKYFLYEFYKKHDTSPSKPLNRLLLASLIAVLTVALSFGIFTTTIPVSAVSIDVENSSVEIELNSLNRVIKATCFGEEKFFSEAELKNLSCDEAVSLIMKRTENKKTNAHSATLTVNCKSKERAQKIADTISLSGSSDLEITCHSADGNLSRTAHSHGISTGKYKAYLILKEYEPDLKIEEICNTPMSELNERIRSFTCKSPTESSSHSSKVEHHEESTHSNGKHNGKNDKHHQED